MECSTRRRLSLGMGWMLLGIALVVVPPLAFAGSQPRRGVMPAREAMPAQDDLVTACQTHCQATSTAIDALRTRVQAAQASNDPAQMRAVLDEVQPPLAAMQEHIATCLHMMGMMPPGHSGMGGRRQ